MQERVADSERWYVQVAIDAGQLLTTELYALGPVHSWSRARELANKWERLHGPNTALVTTSPRRGAALDALEIAL